MRNLEKLAKLIRYYSLVSTTEAGSGHPTSSLSAADLMTVLMFGRRSRAESREGFFRFDLENPNYANNDRLIFSKGHASPLFYSMYAAAGKVSEAQLLSLRKFGSHLEGHPTMEFKYTEVPTGSLGQGLSVGVGMALNAKLDKLSYNTFVLLGDSEMAEGSVWEAMEIASFYKLNNLIAILDCNRLGQRGETMLGHHTEVYQKRAEAFGWETMVIDGHSLADIQTAFEKVLRGNHKHQDPRTKQISNDQNSNSKPKIIIAKTLKGKGVSFIEDKDGWHGKALSREELNKALEELGPIDKNIIGELATPEKAQAPSTKSQEPNKIQITNYQSGQKVATRKAYGNALVNLVEANYSVVVLDAETSNSTYAEMVKKTHPERFFEMFIAEQNMVGAALGLSRRGKIPFVSTFAAFFTRAFDQIRMSQYVQNNIHPVKSAEGGAATRLFNGVKFVGSHAGVSIGEDGASQMGLEELAMFRTLLDSVVLYPSDAVSCEKLVYEAARHQGNVYIQTTRKDTAILYSDKRIENRDKALMEHNFKIGGSCVLRSSENDAATVVAAGITVHEALAAYEELKKEGSNIRVIDLYSIKPLDIDSLQKAAKETKVIITVEDSYPEGGIGEAVAATLSQIPNIRFQISNLAVRRMPRSGKPEELLAYEEIDSKAIVKKVAEILSLPSRTSNQV